jgi:sugar phosphate isomerase/epimerase
MSQISRREFIKKTAADAALVGFVAAGVTELQANPLGLPIGSQTYPHRAMIKEGNFAGLLKTLKDIGVERIELCSAIGYAEFSSLADGKQTAKMIADHGLKCESAHFSMRELRESQDKSIAWAKDIGITQMVTATLGMPPDKAPITADYVKKAADEYNKIGAVAAKAGIQQALHNEGFELSEVDGKRTYDLLLGLLDAKLVKMQFQMSTISRGFVAHEYFAKYPGRFVSMHLQDVDLKEAQASQAAQAAAPAAAPAPAGGGQPGGGQAGGGMPQGGGRGRGQRPVGKGSIDWVKTFQAAKVGGVKNYFVEQSMELTKESVAFLKTLKA